MDQQYMDLLEELSRTSIKERQKISAVLNEYE